MEVQAEQAVGVLQFAKDYGAEGLCYVILGVSTLFIALFGILLYGIKKSGQHDRALQFLRAFTIGIFLADIGLRQIPLVPEENIFKLFILLGLGFSFFLDRFLYRQVSIFVPTRVVSQVISNYNFRDTPMRKARAERGDVSPARSVSPTPTTPRGRTKVVLKKTGGFWLGMIFTTLHTYTFGMALLSTLTFSALVTAGQGLVIEQLIYAIVHVAGQVSLIRLAETPIGMTMTTTLVARVVGIALVFLGQSCDTVGRYAVCALIGNMLVISLTGLMSTVGAGRKALPIVITLVGIFVGIATLYAI